MSEIFRTFLYIDTDHPEVKMIPENFFSHEVQGKVTKIGRNRIAADVLFISWS